MELLVGVRPIRTCALRRTGQEVEAVLKGGAALPLLDAALHGMGVIRLREGLGPKARLMEVSRIEMAGDETRITLVGASGAAAALH